MEWRSDEFDRLEVLELSGPVLNIWTSENWVKGVAFDGAEVQHGIIVRHGAIFRYRAIVRYLAIT